MIEEVTLEEATFRPPPRRFEAGTPPIAAAIGLGGALDWMQRLDWHAIQTHELRLTRRLLDGLASIAGVRVLGPLDTHDRRGVVTFSLEGFSAEETCRSLDTRGVALRGGHHCAQPLVRAFGVDGAARASLAPYSVDEDVDALLEGLEELVGARSARASPRSRG
jgi:cysteine desulfurase/selenocysteine lyase